MFVSSFIVCTTRPTIIIYLYVLTACAHGNKLIIFAIIMSELSNFFIGSCHLVYIKISYAKNDIQRRAYSKIYIIKKLLCIACNHRVIKNNLYSKKIRNKSVFLVYYFRIYFIVLFIPNSLIIT